MIRAILAGDDEGFWQAEAEARCRAGVPPFGRLAGVIVTGPDEARTWDVARALARAADLLAPAGAELYGPAPAPVARIRGRHRVRLLVKAPKGAALQPALRAWAASVPVPATSASPSTSTRRASSDAASGGPRAGGPCHIVPAEQTIDTERP